MNSTLVQLHIFPAGIDLNRLNEYDPDKYGKVFSDINTVELLEKSVQPIKLIVHSNFRDKAIRISRQFLNVEIRTHPETHSKIALVSPETVIFSSAMMGNQVKRFLGNK